MAMTTTKQRAGTKATAAAPKAKKETKREQELKAAWKRGYDSGWNDREKLPKRVGASTAARAGYGQGLKDRKVSEKIQKHRNR